MYWLTPSIDINETFDTVNLKDINSEVFQIKYVLKNFKEFPRKHLRWRDTNKVAKFRTSP